MGVVTRVAGRLGRPLIDRLLGAPVQLPPELLERYPELSGARWRRGGLPPRVGGWVLGLRSVAAITLWRTVFLAPDVPITAELLLHELRHVHQFEASRAFPAMYVLESLRRGYSRNRFETDARTWAARRVRPWDSPSPSEDA